MESALVLGLAVSFSLLVISSVVQKVSEKLTALDTATSVAVKQTQYKVNDKKDPNALRQRQQQQQQSRQQQTRQSVTVRD